MPPRLPAHRRLSLSARHLPTGRLATTLLGRYPNQARKLPTLRTLREFHANALNPPIGLACAGATAKRGGEIYFKLKRNHNRVDTEAESKPI